MTLKVTNAFICWTLVIVAVASADEEKPDAGTVRDDLHYLALSDDSELSVWAQVAEAEKGQTAKVMVMRKRKDERTILRAKWVTQVTSVEHNPNADRNYALVHVSDDRIFIFFPWNGEHCTLDKTTGRVVEKGKGDAVLKQHAALAPLKLKILLPQTGSSAAKQEKSTASGAWKLTEKDLGSGQFSIAYGKDNTIKVQCFIYAKSDPLPAKHREQRDVRRKSMEHDKRMVKEAPQSLRESYVDSALAYDQDFAATADAWQDWQFPVWVPHFGDMESIRRAAVAFRCSKREKEVALLMTCSKATSEKDLATAAHLLATMLNVMPPDEFKKLPIRDHAMFGDNGAWRTEDFAKFFEGSRFPQQH